MLSSDDLHGYQRRAAEFVKTHRGCALFADCGTGKTAATLTAIADLFMTCDVSKALVIAPLRVARYVWPFEIGAWSHTKQLRYSLVVGSAKQRAKALRADAEI